MVCSMEKNRHITMKIIFGVILTFLLSIVICHAAYASGWIDGKNSAIYDGGSMADKENSIQEVLYFVWNNIKNAASDLLSALFSDMIRNTGDRLYYMISMAGIDINSIIYGRVGGASFINDGVALFTYELVPGNPYGIISMYIYGALRMVFVLIILCIIVSRLAAFLYTSGGARQREKLKDTLTYALIILLMVMLMPYVLGVVLYIRDVILYIVMTRGGELISTVSKSVYPEFMDSYHSATVTGIGSDIMYSFFGAAGNYNIVTMFRETAGGNLFNSLMYIGAVVLTVYFAFAYGSAAMSQLVLVVTFPFACAVSLFDRSVMQGWVKQVCGTLMIPIIDSFLLLVPIFFGLLGKSDTVSGYTLIQFILCSCVIPARGVIRMWLGFGGANAMELAGIGALLGAMQLGKAVASTAIGLGMSHALAGKEAAADLSMADMFSEQQGVKEMEEAGTIAQLNQDVGQLFSSSDINDDGQVASEDRKGDVAGGMSGGPVRAGNNQEALRQIIRDLDHRKAVLTDEMKKNDVRAANIATESAMIDEDIAELKADKESARAMGGAGQGRMEECDRMIAENELAKKKLSHDAAGLRKENAIKAGAISRIDTASKRAREAMIGIRAAGGGSSVSEGEQAVLDKYANIDNFDTPEFRNISLERRAELHRERAAVTRQRARVQLALRATGAVAGATMAAGATMFGSPAMKMYGASMGIQAGNGLVSFAEEIYYNRTAATKLQMVSSAGPAGNGEQAVKQPTVMLGDKRVRQEQITQKQTVKRQVLVDHELQEDVVYEDMDKKNVRDFGDEHHQWIYGGNAQSEAFWDQLVSTPEGSERISTEIRRAFIKTGSEVRILRHNMDGDFSRNAEEKNQEILVNAMDIFASEFSFNFMNNASTLDDGSYNPDDLLIYLENKVRDRAPSILKEKLQSMGLLY